jgi:hypothetical protein
MAWWATAPGRGHWGVMWKFFACLSSPTCGRRCGENCTLRERAAVARGEPLGADARKARQEQAGHVRRRPSPPAPSCIGGSLKTALKKCRLLKKGISPLVASAHRSVLYDFPLGFVSSKAVRTRTRLLTTRCANTTQTRQSPRARTRKLGAALFVRIPAQGGVLLALPNRTGFAIVPGRSCTPGAGLGGGRSVLKHLELMGLRRLKIKSLPRRTLPCRNVRL